MSYIPSNSSVVAFQGNPSVLQVLATITNPNQSVSGAVTVSNFPTNPSISGQVGASVIGHAPVVIVGGSIAASFTPPANQSVSGTVQAELLSSNASVIVVGSFAPATNQSVSGTVGASVIGHAPVVIVGGSIAASFTPPANQSVSGTIGASVIGNVPVKGFQAEGAASALIPVQIGGADVDGSVVTARFARDGDMVVHGHSSVISFVDDVSNQQAIPVAQNDNSFMVTPIFPYFFDGTTWDRVRGNATNGLQTYGSVSGTVGASIIGLPPVNVTNTNLNVSGSVAAWLNSSNASVITVGSPVANQSVSGTVNVGNFPTTQNVSGSVVATQGTVPWIIGSVYGNVSGSIAGTYTNSNTPSTVTGIAMMFKQNVVTSVMTEVSPTYPLPVSVMGLTPVSQGGTWTASVFGNMSVIGTVPVTQSGLWQPSALAYVTRNDTVASFLGADLSTRPAMSDSAGRQVVKPFAPEEARIEGYNSVVSGSVTTLVAAAGAGLKNYITDIVLVNTGAATTLVTFRSGGGTSVLGYGIVPTGGGSNMIGFNVPLRTLANETFDFQASTSTSVLYAKVSGYKAP